MIIADSENHTAHRLRECSRTPPQVRAKALLDATNAKTAAMTAANTHVLGLFMQANAYDITSPHH